MFNKFLEYWPYYITVLVLTIVFINAFRKPAELIVLLDVPGARKKHIGSIPLIGGAAILFAFICVSLFLQFPLREYGSLFLGATILLITGIVDDLNEISAKKRLFIQILVALIMCLWGGIKVERMGDLFGYGNIYLDTMSVPFTVLLVVGYINAINMLDGADGLAGGLLFVMGTSLAILSIVSGYTSDGLILLGLFVSAIFAFLLYNYRHPWRKKAEIFMGDSGSMSLSYILIWFAINFTQDANFKVQPISITWILVLPLFDIFSIITRRLLAGKHPFSADRYHIHHLLNRAGFSQRTTVNIILVTSTFFSLIAYIGWREKIVEYYLNYLLFCVFFIYLYFTIYRNRNVYSEK